MSNYQIRLLNLRFPLIHTNPMSLGKKSSSIHTSILQHPYIHPPLSLPFSYSALLAAPSFSIPSHPAALPAISSTLPNPSRLASRFALAAFIASMPACLSVAADEFQASEPVAAPTADCDGKMG
jgi:hypothetical protein